MFASQACLDRGQARKNSAFGFYTIILLGGDPPPAESKKLRILGDWYPLIIRELPRRDKHFVKISLKNSAMRMWHPSRSIRQS